MDYFIGLDIGTSSVKGALVTAEGGVEHSTKETFSYEVLENGGVEYCVQAYLDACFQVLKELAGEVKGGNIKGICASSASGNMVLLDKEGRPMTPLISWQDKRVTNEARELLSDLDTDVFYEMIGWPYGFRAFPLSQLSYMKKYNPQLLSDCGMVAMSTEYLYYVLTGAWGISTSAGTTYFLIDQQKGEYIKPLLELLGISQCQLPPILPCGAVVGTVKADMEAQCGIPSGTPVVLGSFDHPSAARGVGVLKEGEMLLSCGTSWVAFFPILNREKGIRARMLVDPFLAPNGCYGAMVSIPSLSGRLQLYVQRYIDDSQQAFQKLSELAKQSKSGANGLRINPLEEPEDEKIKGFCKADIARAIMEGTVTLLKHRLDDLAEKGVFAQSAIMVGGPSEDPYWISLIEEICDMHVRVVHGSFAGAVGAAIIAGIGVGEYENEEAAHAVFRTKERSG